VSQPNSVHERPRTGYAPVTLTTQVQLAEAWTTKVCAPREDCEVIDCPDGPVWLTAGVPVGDDPTGVTNTWNEGPEAGAGAHLKAQPMFQPAAVVVNVGLVQLPWSCVGPRRTRAGPVAPVAGGVEVVVDPPPVAVVVVDPPPAADVVVDPLPAAVVVVEPPAAVVVVEPVDFGRTYAGAVDAFDDFGAPPTSWFRNIPISAATSIPTASCHVLQDRLSSIWSSPGAGIGSPPLDASPA
jgi:hypothetical protein